MQRVCDVLEKLTAEEILGNYAIGGATAAGFHGEPDRTRMEAISVQLLAVVF
jgi:hypothetical protein